MSHAHWLALAAPMLVGACRVGTNAPVGTGRLTAAEHLAASAPIAAQAERLSHCPSAVAGATTVVVETPDAVEVRVTATGEEASEVRRRAAVLPAASETTRGKHRGDGSANAQFGRCPVVMRDTTLEVRDIPGGAAILVRPSHPSELDWLRREVETRSAQLAAPKPFGPGLMKTCPSAVPNSETTVAKTSSGVDVRVVAKSAAATRAVRERAKEMGASWPSRDERCPTSARNVTLATSEVPGGVIISLKPKRPEDLERLWGGVRARARSFEAVRTR